MKSIQSITQLTKELSKCPGSSFYQSQTKDWDTWRGKTIPVENPLPQKESLHTLCLCYLLLKWHSCLPMNEKPQLDSVSNNNINKYPYWIGCLNSNICVFAKEFVSHLTFKKKSSLRSCKCSLLWPSLYICLMNECLCLFCLIQIKHSLIVLSLNASLGSPTNSANYFLQWYVEAGRVSNLSHICPVAVVWRKKHNNYNSNVWGT